jgi:hypothetical protein
MLRIDGGATPGYCDGVSRRSFLQVGLTGLGGMSLPGLLRAREATANTTGIKKDTSVILIWLDGGAGHMDMYDMKPEAPVEYRGLWRPIKTIVPGLEVTELMPKQTKIADKFSIIRSLNHDSGDHFTGGHWMLTGRNAGVSGGRNAGKYPFWGSIATKVLGARQAGMPPNVGIPYAMSIGIRPGYFGANYLGVQYDPFETVQDPNNPKFQVQNLSLPNNLTIERLEDRKALLDSFDNLRRNADRSGTIEAMDRFNQRAFEMVTGSKARNAFDIEREDPDLRDRYGRNTWGQSTLLARRLVEAGSTIVSCHFGGWDNHWDLERAYNNYLPRVDVALTTLFEDLVARDLYDKTMVVMCGEFGRTPRMNDGGNGGPPMSKGTPGRDHWGNAMFVLVGGGGVKGGQVIGSTNNRGEEPKDRPLKPGDLHHTIFHVLGVDPSLNFLDHSGRPIPAIDHGSVIEELV